MNTIVNTQPLRMTLPLLVVVLLGSARCADQPSPTGAAVEERSSTLEVTEVARPGPVISLDNLSANEILPHDLAVLQGTVRNGAPSIRVKLGDRTSDWPVVQTQFRAMVLLARGSNTLTLTAANTSGTFRLTYTPPTNPRFIRFVYLVAADGDGSFDAPAGEPHDRASALARMKVDARLMQTFVAETMRRQGFGRRTFPLARDATGEPIVEVFRSRLTTAQARSMEDGDLWLHFFEELGALPARDLSLDVAVMSMSHFDPATGNTLAHAALGGGRLGLFGSSTLHTHAASLEQVAARFADGRLIDASTLQDDSAGRGTFWANYATGLGATQHEMGHCLSLPHPANHQGFMSRSFDFINRTFVISEPPSLTSPGLAPVRPADEAGIDRSGAVRLRFHRWLAATNVNYAVNIPPSITTDASNLRVASTAGIRHVQYLVNGEGADHDEFLGTAPTTVTVSLTTLRTRLPSATTVSVSAIDNDGNIGELNDILIR